MVDFWVSDSKASASRHSWDGSRILAESRNDTGLPSSSSSIHTELSSSSFMAVESVTSMLAELPTAWTCDASKASMDKDDFASCSCVVTEVYCNVKSETLINCFVSSFYL
jgi:hypothetical protein